ncbi:MAG: hypothetical protein Kow00107_08880 [Planctomycetota bacterium]
MVYRQGSNKEEEWALKQEKARIEKLKKQKEEEGREELKKLHWMHCPKCGEDLKTVKVPEFHLEIDECPGCGGVWFDKGELERYRQLSVDRQKTVLDKLLSIFK